MAKDTVSEAMLQIRASTDKLRTDLQRGEGMLRGSLQKMQTLTRTILPALGIGFGVSALVGGLRELANEADRLGKLSTQLGASVEDLDKLGQVAELSGSNLETASNAIFRLSQSIIEAERSSSGRAARALQLLNIEVDELLKLGPVAQFERLSKAIVLIENPTVRAEAGAALFGRQVKELLPLMQSLADDGLNKVSAVMTTEFAEASQRLNDDLTSIGNAFKRLTVQLVGPVASALREVLDLMNRATPTTETALLDRVDQLNSAVAVMNSLQYRTPEQEKELVELVRQLKEAEDALGRLQARAPQGTSVVLPPPSTPAGTAGRTVPREPNLPIDFDAILGNVADFEEDFGSEVIGDLLEQFERFDEEAARSMDDLGVAAGRLGFGLESGIGGALRLLFSDAKDLDEGFKALFQNLAISAAEAAFQLLVLEPILKSIKDTMASTGTAGTGGGGGGGFNIGDIFSKGIGLLAGLLHEGGVVGQPGPLRVVSPAAFMNAPRFHMGLASNEVPAILEQGETVRTAAQERALGKEGGNVMVTINGDIIPRRNFATREEIVTISRQTVLRDMDADGPIRRKVKTLK